MILQFTSPLLKDSCCDTLRIPLCQGVSHVVTDLFITGLINFCRQSAFTLSLNTLRSEVDPSKMILINNNT